ncbi:response regulator transcription factor [Dongia sp.]|uniref:response regulator transcription factor n=1 Tax=Dongia sp. TaxID=1977262 RepID=UPI00374FE1E3
MANLNSIVYLVDDDRRILTALTRLLESDGRVTQAFTSSRAFLEAHDPEIPGCVVLDLLMPEMSGLALQHELQKLGRCRPVIFLSGRAGIPACASAMKAGAVDFLTKPVEADLFLSTVGRALVRDAAEREQDVKRRALTDRMTSLTQRERQVLDGVVEGLLNKQIANRLGIVEKTVKVHRAHAISKLGARSTAELVRMVYSLGPQGAATTS